MIALDGSALPPEISEQYEGGFKTEFFDKRLLTNVAFFHITKQNLAVGTGGFVHGKAIGQARSQGIEVDVTGKVTDNLNLIATYAYTDAIAEKGDNAGKRLWNVPRNAGSLWAKYDFLDESFKGLSVGSGVYIQDQKEGDAGNTFELPGYARLDALVKYQLPVNKTKTTLQLNVQNLLDHQYYTSTVGWSNSFVNPGMPRTFMGSIKFEF
jgi:iron complex outermembrane receptor protein